MLLPLWRVPIHSSREVWGKGCRGFWANGRCLHLRGRCIEVAVDLPPSGLGAVRTERYVDIAPTALISEFAAACTMAANLEVCAMTSPSAIRFRPVPVGRRHGLSRIRRRLCDRASRAATKTLGRSLTTSNPCEVMKPTGTHRCRRGGNRRFVASSPLRIPAANPLRRPSLYGYSASL